MGEVTIDLNEPTQTVQLFPEAERMPLYWENLLAEEKIVVDQGGMYSGKTEAIIRVLFTYACLHPNLIIHVVASTITKLREDSMLVAERIVNSNAIIRHFLLGVFNKSNRQYTFRNGSVISFNSYENAEQAEGAKRDILYINEARRIPWAVAYLLIKRTNFKVFLDYNPVGRFWAHDKIINCPATPVVKNGVKSMVKEFPSVKVIRSWHVHNEFLSPEKHDEVENIADQEMWKAYARGLTAQLSGLVYPNWHEVPDNYLNGAHTIIWGIDLGFTNDPTVILRIGVGVGDYDFVFDEIPGVYVPGIPSWDMAQKMKENGYKFGQPAYMDHKDSTRRELRRLRIVAINAMKGPGSVEAGILFLRKKRCAFTARSKNLKEELGAHMFSPLKDGTNSNTPEHQYSHGPSAARYGAYTHAVRHNLVKAETDEVQEPDDEMDDAA